MSDDFGIGRALSGMAFVMSIIIIIAVIFVPFGVWKVAELLIKLCHHIHWV